MGQLSNYMENKLLDHTFGNGVYTRPSGLFLTMTTDYVVDADTGGSISEILGSTQDGFVEHLTLAENNYSAGVFQDLTANNNDGTPANAPSFANAPDGRADRATVFNGTTDYIQVASSSDFALNTPFSVSLWVYQTGDGSSNPSGLVTISNGFSDFVFFQLYNDKRFRVLFDDGSGAISLTKNAPNFQRNKWEHLALTHDLTDWEYYLNGVSVGTSNSPSLFPATSHSVRIGSDISGRDFKGNGCNVRIYNRALTSAEITAIYNDELAGGSNFARISCDDFASASGRSTVNNTLYSFPTPSADWGVAYGWAVLDTATLLTGNIIAYGDWSPAKIIESEASVDIKLYELEITYKKNGSSNYLANATLDHLFEGSAFTPPTNIYMGFTTSAIADTDTGSTVSEPASGYARTLINNWDAASDGESVNTDVLESSTATDVWGDISKFLLADALTTGNILFHGALDEAIAITKYDFVSLDIGDITISLD